MREAPSLKALTPSARARGHGTKSQLIVFARVCSARWRCADPPAHAVLPKLQSGAILGLTVLLRLNTVRKGLPREVATGNGSEKWQKMAGSTVGRS
jgi:hypothetical protein